VSDDRNDDLRPSPPPEEVPGGDSMEKRFALEQQSVDRLIRWATPFISVAIAVLIGSVIILLTGGSPIEAFSAMFQGAFGTQRAIGETLVRATPLMFTGLAVAYGFRSGLFNIGAEGQLYLGGLAAAFLGVQLGGMQPLVAVPLVLLGAMLAGAAWAFIPALLKATRGAHEVITTMMFTYIGRYLVDWLVTGRLKAPGAVPQTVEIGVNARLARLFEVFPFLQSSRAHMGFLVACGAALVVWLIFKYTTLGFEARAVGFNPLGAQNAGISIASTTIKSLCISGALAGLAGASEVLDFTTGCSPSSVPASGSPASPSRFSPRTTPSRSFRRQSCSGRCPQAPG